MSLIRDLDLDPISFQLGVLKGSGRSDAEIAAFAEVMATEHSVRPGPRSERPRHVLHPTESLRGDEPHTTASPRHQPANTSGGAL